MHDVDWKLMFGESLTERMAKDDDFLAGLVARLNGMEIVHSVKVSILRNRKTKVLVRAMNKISLTQYILKQWQNV